MKKAFKIIGGILLGIIAAVIILPIAFSGTLEKIAKKEISNFTDNKVTVDWNDFSLSIFSSFPDVRAGIEKLVVVCNGRFEGDTLLFIDNFKADMDIMSAINGNYKINKLIVDGPMVRGVVAADSIANWDVIASDTTAIEEPDTTNTSPLKLALEMVQISKAKLAYIDSTSNMSAFIENLNLTLSGDMDADVTTLKLGLDVASLNFWMDKIKYLSNSTIDFNAQIEADLANNKYTFSDNTLNFSGIPLEFDGYAQLIDSIVDMDINLKAKETSFKTILALVPEYIMKDVEGLKTDGSLQLYAHAKGQYVNMDQIPAIDAVFQISNGLVKYPDLPKQLSDINIDLAINNPGGPADITTIDVNKLHFDLGGNPFDVSLNLKKPMSNPTFAANAKGTIDLGSLKDALPLDSMAIEGIVNADLRISSDMKAIEQEQYEDINASGSLGLKDFHFEGSALPSGADISEALLRFSPTNVELNPFSITLGKSDFSLTGKVEDYLQYLLKDGTIKGTAKLQSKYIDANELMQLTASEPDTSSTQIAAEEPAPASVIEVPKNIDFTFITGIDKILYDNLNIENVRGTIIAKNGIATLSNLNLDMCDGTIGLTGKYNPTVVTKPTIDMDINMKKVDINKLTNSISTIDSLLPIARKTHGKVSINLDVVADLDTTMSPVPKTINGKGSFSSESIGIKESDFQSKLSTVMGNTKYNDLTIKDAAFNFNINDGNIIVDPFDMKLFNKTATFSGQQGLDQSMNYLLTMPTAREDLAGLLSSAGISASTWSQGADIPLGRKIVGTLTSPDIKLDLDAAKDAIIGEVKEQAKEKVQEEAGKLLDKAAEKLGDNEKTKDAVNKLKGLFGKKK